jgi:uncharacterized protein YjbI with pentapeptide repeats
MSEQPSETATTTATAPTPSDAWGHPISEERQAELQGYLDRWATESDHGDYKGPFDTGPGESRVILTGADVFWLAEQSGRSLLGLVPNLHLEGANLREAHLEGARLREAHLEGAFLREAHLEGASLDSAHLERADLTSARLEEASLQRAHLERAFLSWSHLERATLFQTQLEKADLHQAHLDGAELHDAHLEGTNLQGAHLERADLTSAWFDKTSTLSDAIPAGASLDQVSFDQTNLTVVDWSLVDILGDEQTARTRKDKHGETKNRTIRLNEYKSAVRANRLLAVALRAQGMNEDADRFAYRAQFLQQQVLWRQRKFGGYFFSRLLDGLAGYGYKPVRGLIAYVVVILGFALAYTLATHGMLTFGLTPSSIKPLQWYEALVLSISSFHGRGFFQPVQSLGDPVAIIAAAEAIIGLLIEISFIATFTQRFFGR